MKLTTAFHRTSLYISLFVATTSISSMAAAGMSDGNWYLKAHGGAGWYSEGKDQRLNYTEGDYDVFKNDSGKEVAFQYGLGAGYRFEIGNECNIELGVGWYGDVEHEYKGFIDQYGQTNLRDYNYSYKIQTQRLMFEGRWGSPMHEKFQGFVTGGLGIGWNKFSGYQYNILDPNEESPKPQFGDNTKNNFVWQIGVGVSWMFMAKWRASLYYLYANNGKAEASANDEFFSNKYETDDITSHSLMFDLSYQF